MLYKLTNIFDIPLDDFLDDDCLEKSQKNNKYYLIFLKNTKIIIFLNFILIILGYFEVTELFGFHFPFISLLLFIFLIVSSIIFKINNEVLITKRNIILFFVIFISSLILSYIGVDLVSIIDEKSNLYIKGMVLGRLTLILLISSILFIELKLIRKIKR